MSMFGQAPDPGAWSGWERSIEAPDVSTFAKQQWDDAKNVSNFDAAIINYKDAFDSVNDKIRGATGQEIFNPMGADQGPLASLQAGTTFSRQGFQELSPVKAWSAKIQELRQQHPDALDWDAIADEPHKAAWERMKAVRDKTNEMSQAAGLIEGADIPLVGKIPYAGAAIGMLPAFVYNTVRHPQYSLAQLGASFAAQMTSPIDATINLLSFGAGGAAKSLAKNAVMNASVNAVGQSILSAPKQLSYRDAGMPYGAEVWLNEIAGAAAAGFAIDAGIRGPARSILRRYGRDVPAGQAFSRNTERAGAFFDLPDDLKLPPGVPVRDQPSEELVKRAMENDPAALRELAEKTGAIEDPRVKGALDHIDLGGAVDEATAKFFKDNDIDNGEGFRVLHDAITGQYDYIRQPQPIPKTAAPLMRAEASDLVADGGVLINRFMESIGPRLAAIGPSVRQYIETAVESGFADILPTISKAVKGAISRDDFVKAVAEHIQAIGPEKAQALTTIYGGQQGTWATAAAMRKFPELVDSNLPVDSDFMRGARSLSQLDDDAFLNAMGLPESVAAIVADLVPPGMHGKVVDDLRASNITDPTEARQAIPLLMPREMPTALSGGSKMDDPTGPEAVKQTERLAIENAEAIKEAEKPIKAREKLEQKAEDLLGQIAKLEAKASTEGAKLYKIAEQQATGLIILDRPLTLGDYIAQAMRNLKATSRTAAGTVDTTASAGKAAAMAEGLTGEQAAAAANANFERVIAELYTRLDDLPKTGAEMADFADQLALEINRGILREGALLRTGEGLRYPYTNVAEIELAREQFGAELVDRLNNPKSNPIETAAWIEWRANLTDHLWADGVGKTSKALAAIPLMKAGVPLPEYRSNKEFFSNASKKKYSPLDGPKSYLDADWRKFLTYYKTLMPIKETRQVDGFGTPEFEANRPLIIDGKAAKGYEQAFKYLEKKFAEHSDGEIANDRRAVIVLGPPGSGKSSSINPLARKLKAAAVNSDDPKFLLPEMKLGAEIVHEEASSMAKRVQQTLIEKGSNVIIEKIGDRAGSILELASILRDDYGYQVDVVDVTAPREMLIQRIAQRAEKTGRDVPTHVLDDALAGVSKTLQALDESGLVRERVSVDTSANRAEITRSSPGLGAELYDAIKSAPARKPSVVSGDRRPDGRPIQPDGEGAGSEAASGEGGKGSRAAKAEAKLESAAEQIGELRAELLETRNQIAALSADIEQRPLSLTEQILNSAAIQRAKDVERAVIGALNLARRILPEGTPVELVDELIDPATGLKLDATSDMSTGAITLALRALNPGARLGHEAVHTLVTAGHLSPDEVRLLAAAARKAGLFGRKIESDYRKSYADRADLEGLLDEEAAAAFIEARIENPDPRIMSIRDRIDAVLERIRNFLAGDGFTSAEDIRNAILRGDTARREAVEAWRRNGTPEGAKENRLFAIRDLAKQQRATAIEDLGPDAPHPGRVVAFHGTRAKARFDSLDVAFSDDFALHFGTADQANTRIRGGASEAMMKDSETVMGAVMNDSRVMPVVINIDPKRIVTLPDLGGWHPEAVARVVAENWPSAAAGPFRNSIEHVVTKARKKGGGAAGDRKAYAALRAEMSKRGIDGVRYWNTGEGAGWSYAVWAPGKVKSATSDNLMFALGKDDEPRPPLHADMAAINRLDNLTMLAEACRG